MQTKIEDLKLLIQEKKEKQIHYNNLRKNEGILIYSLFLIKTKNHSYFFIFYITSN